MDKISYLIFNIIERIYHRVTDREKQIIKDTHLFDQLSPAELSHIFSSIYLIKYPKDVLIFKAGAIADAIYVIVRGAVQVTTLNNNKEKIFLARLNPGDYFGEQALLWANHKTRSASIATIEETILIKIPASSIPIHWNENYDLKLKLRKIGFQQAMHALTSSVSLYEEIKEVLEDITDGKILTYPAGNVIFNYGDISRYLYIILQGEIELLFPHEKAQKEYKSLILHAGHIFGELGVLNKQTRVATAVSLTPVRLLEIEGEIFKTRYSRSPQIRRLCSDLQHVYTLPTQGVVEQYLGKLNVIGDAITSIYKLNDHRLVIAIRSLNDKIFSMTEVNATHEKNYVYRKDPKIRAELSVNNNHLVKIELFGVWESLPIACRILLDKEKMSEEELKKFSATGELPRGNYANEINPDDKIICTCLSVSKKMLKEAMAKGAKDLATISKETGACTVCRACQFKILEILGANPWMKAIMQREIQHNHYINSYSIKPTDGSFQHYLPGQHVIIQAKINGIWIERPYTISRFSHPKNLWVTIKKELQGMFSNWLFNAVDAEIPIEVSPPQGSFTLNTNSIQPILCLAGGIGITPFIAFANELGNQNLSTRLHIIYCANDEKDFIYNDLFSSIHKKYPNFTIAYQITNKDGFLSNEKLQENIKMLNNPQIYICGPKVFIEHIKSLLNSMGYDSKKVFVEAFFTVNPV